MQDMTPELGVERGFYQRDINSVCNASLRLPLRSVKGAGSEMGAGVAKPRITVLEFLLLT